MRGRSRATELTRTGRLDEATALIRSLVQGRRATAEPTPVGDGTEGAFPGFDAPSAAAARLDVHAARRVGKGLGETLHGIAAGGLPRSRALTPVPRKQRVTRDEIAAALRASGESDIGGIGSVVLETDGSMTVVQRSR